MAGSQILQSVLAENADEKFVINELFTIVDEDNDVEIESAIKLIQVKHPNLNVVNTIIDMIDNFMDEHGISKSSLKDWDRKNYRQNHYKYISDERKEKLKSGVNNYFAEKRDSARLYGNKIEGFVKKKIASNLQTKALEYIVSFGVEHKELFEKNLDMDRMRTELFESKDKFFKSQVKKYLEKVLKSGE